MLKNYLVIAWRTLFKNRLFTIINITGLALSMSVSMIVLIRFMDSISYDNFHNSPEKIFRILSTVTNDEGNSWTLATTPLPLYEALSKEDGIEQSIHIYPSLKGTGISENKKFEIKGAFTQPAFFEIFNFKLKYGDAAQALRHVNGIVLTEILAEKFFGATNPVGKMLIIEHLGSFEVTGVMYSFPGKSHLTFDAYASATSILQLEKTGNLPVKYLEWNSFESAYTYVKIGEGVKPNLVEKLLSNISADINKASDKGSFQFLAQNISSITPSGDIVHEVSRGPSWGSLLAEASIGLIILIAASFNYTNLSVARALSRGKEVGIRKLAGARRWQIFLQYISESVLIALFALLLANVILGFILEYKPFNDGYELVPDVSWNVSLLIVFFLFSLFTGLMAGAMPAWILSSFKPIRVLRNIGTEQLLGKLSLRKALMIFQFSLSLVILVFLSAFYKQFDYLAKGDTGFRSKNILMVSESSSIINDAFEKVTGVKAVGLTSAPFAFRSNDYVKASVNVNDPNASMLASFDCNSAFFGLMNLEMVAGKYFSEASLKNDEMVVNVKAVAAFGFKSPHDAVGSRIFLQDSIPYNIRGVVADFYHSGFGNEIKPLIFKNDISNYKYTVLEINEKSKQEILPRLSKEWKKIYPDHQFDYFWYQEKLDENNDQTAEISMLGFLGFMTVTIASMGMLGLVIYTVETKRKEISIRKIVGAAVSQCVVILSSGFVKILLWSGLIALPIGYFLSQAFLTNFVNQTSFGFLDLIPSFVFLLMIGLCIILSQTYKVANENPSKNLRSE